MSSWENFLKPHNYIDGLWVEADSKETLPVHNPATGETLGAIPKSAQVETARAIAAAKAAFDSWSQTTALHRANVLMQMHDAIMDQQEILAELLTREQGKPMVESMGEVGTSAAYLRWFAEQARRVTGSIVQSPITGRELQVIKQPVGVVASITPWNFPSSMLARKIGPALAVGCTTVVKPAELTPYSGIAWAVLAEQVGLPKGVLNVLTGDAPAIGAEFCANPDVAKISFTGSTAVGKLLLAQSAGTVKKVSMELGGNAPFIVFDDADLDRAVAGGIAAKFRNSGQTCVCTNRFYVQHGVYEVFLEKFSAAVAALKVDNGLNEGAQQGPLINAAAIEKVEDLLGDAKSHGGRVLTGGARHEKGGQFFTPTVIADANAEMRFTREEIFGPLAPVYVFEDEGDAIRMANNTRYGLAAFFYTKDLGRAHRVSARLEYGLVGVNEGVITTVEAPFGGVKESGLGKEGGEQGLDDYLESKFICYSGI